jgi:hypothetical protein
MRASSRTNEKESRFNPIAEPASHSPRPATAEGSSPFVTTSFELLPRQSQMLRRVLEHASVPYPADEVAVEYNGTWLEALADGGAMRCGRVGHRISDLSGELSPDFAAAGSSCGGDFVLPSLQVRQPPSVFRTVNMNARACALPRLNSLYTTARFASGRSRNRGFPRWAVSPFLAVTVTVGARRSGRRHPTSRRSRLAGE